MASGRPTWSTRVAAGLGLAWLALGRPALAADPPTTPTAPAAGREAELEDRLRRLEELNRRVLEQYDALSKKYEALEQRLADRPATPEPSTPPAPPDPVEMPPRLTEPSLPAPVPGIWTAPGPAPDPKAPRYEVDYNNGFLIAPVDPDKTPFLLRVNGRMEFRHTGFAPTERFWWNSAGDRLRIEPRNDFEIERGRLLFSGYFIDRKLEYFLQLDFDTDDAHDANALDYWINYRFSRAFNLHFGKGFVPGSRQWLAGAWRLQFADRSLANTFFRPDRSVGIWATGEVVDGVEYRTMVANGFNTSDLNVEEIDLNFAWSGTIVWDVFGNYGPGYTDIQWHETPGALVGTSLTAARSTGPGPINQPALEQNFVRLSDGTRLTLPGALAPGLTVNAFDIYLWAIDGAFKYRGFSFNGEYYLRWIDNIAGIGAPVPFTAMFDTGFYGECGYFVVPKKLELIAKTSQIWGKFGSGAEYAGGLNWYINGTHDWKFTFDVTRLIGSPAQNAGPNYRAGDTGVLFRTQLIAVY